MAASAAASRWTVVTHGAWLGQTRRAGECGFRTARRVVNLDTNTHHRRNVWLPKCRAAFGEGSSSNEATEDTPLPGLAPVALDASPRWDLVHARSVSSVAEILMHKRDAQKVIRKALRMEWCGFDEISGWAGNAWGGGINNAERLAIAETVLGVEVNRLTLAWLVVERTRSADPEVIENAGGVDAFGVDALDAVLCEFGLERAFYENEKNEREAPRRPEFVAAATAMVTLHWTHTRDDVVGSAAISKETVRVLRGGAKMVAGDAWPTGVAENNAARNSLPVWFARRLLNERGEANAFAIANALKQVAPLMIRRNGIMCPSVEHLKRALSDEGVATSTLTGAATAVDTGAFLSLSSSTKTPQRENENEIETPGSGSVPLPTQPPVVLGAPDCLRLLEGRPRVGIFGLDTYRKGWFEVQDPGSQCIATAVVDGVTSGTISGLKSSFRRQSAADENEEEVPTTSNDDVITVLDTCCGSGGKTLAIASALHETGVDFRVDCFDLDRRRLRHLTAACERAGCADSVRVVSRRDLQAVANVGGTYDAVLVDAPCSSTGAVRRNPSLRWGMVESQTLRSPESFGIETTGGVKTNEAKKTGEKKEKRFFDDDETETVIDGDLRTGSDDRVGVVSFPSLQLCILREASSLVKPNGGVLVYATCSVLKSENEDVACEFEAGDQNKKERKWAPFPFAQNWPAAKCRPKTDCAATAKSQNATHFVGLNPSAHGTDGFFMARWRSRVYKE